MEFFYVFWPSVPKKIIIILISNTIKVPSNNASLSNLLCQVFLQCGPTTTNCFHLQQIVLSTTFSF